MHNHLYYKMLDRSDLGEGCAKLNDLKYFLRENIELDTIIAQKFPLASFGNPSDSFLIKGTDVLVTAFQNIDAEKLDLVEKLENMEYIGLSHNDEIILNFKDAQIDDILSAAGIYNFTNTFLDELFNMGKFANFCIRNNYQDILKDNLVRLFSERKTTERQYRFIKKNQDYFLRGFTSSNRYQNYDNNIAIYLSLLNIHKFSKDNGVTYSVRRARLSDSEIRIAFEQEQPKVIPGLGKVYFGIVVSNSEIRESAVAFEVRYRLVDERNSNYSFAMTPELQDSVYNINHGTGIEKIEAKMSKIANLKSIQESMVTLITGIKELKTLSADAMHRLFEKIVNAKNLSKETKVKFRDLYDKRDVENAMSLIQAFDKINSITTDIDERIFLERVYYSLIRDMASRQRQR